MAGCLRRIGGRMRLTLTNKLGLPDVIVRAVRNDPYVGGGDISVTRLISPPYQAKLLREHGEIVDVSDRIWALVGQIGHGILERIPADVNVVREERLFMPILGWTVSGQFDLIEGGVLTDFKFTTVWSADGKEEWEQQLNLLSLMLRRLHREGGEVRRNGEYVKVEPGDARYHVERAQIIAIFRDWSKLKAKSDRDYPQSQVAVIPVELWPEEKQLEFATERVRLHQQEDPPPCTPEERWARPEVFACMKRGRTVSTKNCASRAEAEQWIAAQQDVEKFRIEYRPGTFVRCESYCGVASVCPHWNNVVF